MKLFTYRFIKDLLIIFIFCGGFYILLHNPITYPKLPKETGLWSIQLLQQPLILGLAGHNYLVLRDNKNTIQREYHGLATNQKGDWQYIGKDSSDELKVWEFDGPYIYLTQKKSTGIMLVEADKKNILALWERAEPCKEAINAMNIPYPPYGFSVHKETENSNSVAFTLAWCMGLDLSADHLGLITPGWGKNLLESD